MRTIDRIAMEALTILGPILRCEPTPEPRDARMECLDEIERVARDNAAGFVSRAYDPMNDEFVWVYGSLRFHPKYNCAGNTYDIDEQFKLSKGDTRIDWVQFKAWIISKWGNKRHAVDKNRA